MEHFAGIDVSLECSSDCVVDATGKIVSEGKKTVKWAGIMKSNNVAQL